MKVDLDDEKAAIGLEKNSKDCKHGWNDGSCCCNCSNLVLVNRHPSNTLVEAKGSMLTTFGFGCKAMTFDESGEDENKIDRIIFSSSLHGMCELHCRNKPKTLSTR